MIKEKRRTNNANRGYKKQSTKNKHVNPKTKKKQNSRKNKKQEIQTKNSRGSKGRQCSATVSDDCLTVGILLKFYRS